MTGFVIDIVGIATILHYMYTKTYWDTVSAWIARVWILLFDILVVC